MNVTSHELDAFVRKVDELGGPGNPAADAYCSGFAYSPSVNVDTALDPDDPAYATQMLALYEEISGRQLDQKLTEMSEIHVDTLVDVESPYAFQPPADRALHYVRIARAFHATNLATGAKVLDMGCGWGLSSELLAQLGFKVTAIDINPLFVELVQRRARRLGLNIEARQSTFEEACSDGAIYDAVFFYECLHHAVNPKQLLASIAASLSPRGQVILTGEPIQSSWWPHWGLRLDALSVYCIRKFGWFESGWSQGYLSRILAANDLVPTYSEDMPAGIGRFVFGNKSWTLERRDWEHWLEPTQWWLEGDKAVSNRADVLRSTLTLYRPKSANKVVFELWNYSPAKLPVTIDLGRTNTHVKMAVGRNVIAVDFAPGETAINCVFSCSAWSPAKMLGNNDPRLLGFHLKQISFSE